MGGSISAPTPPKLGAWLARTNNTIYQAATEGFCTGYGITSSNVQVYTDGNATPTTKRNQNASGTSATGVTCPVKAGDYWKISGATGGLYWIPVE